MTFIEQCRQIFTPNDFNVRLEIRGNSVNFIFHVWFIHQISSLGAKSIKQHREEAWLSQLFTDTQNCLLYHV